MKMPLGCSFPKSLSLSSRTSRFAPRHLYMHRLLDDPTSPPESVYLVVQKQVALKHARPKPTTLKTLHWSPWYRFSAGLELPADAFHPKPEVAACLMVAAKRGPPLVEPGHRHLFLALVRQAFEGRGNSVGKVLGPTFTRTQLRRLAKDNRFTLDLPPPCSRCASGPASSTSWSAWSPKTGGPMQNSLQEEKMALIVARRSTVSPTTL